MSENEIEKIEPVDFDISKSALFSAESVEPKQSKPSLLVWLSLGALAVVALAVIFVLPAIVSEYELPLERRTEVANLTSANPSQVPPAINAISPFDEAQRSLQRKEAQDVLAELLAAQAELDSLGVENWAGPTYEEALSFAKVGDESYLVQEFVEALNSYEEGLMALQALLDTVPTVLSQQLIDAEAALTLNQSALALEKFEIVLQLDPGNSQAEAGKRKAETLDEVNSLLSQAGNLAESGELDAARELYLSALDLDNTNTITQQGIRQIDRQILENEFAQIMSEGYSLLQNSQPEQAIEAFQRAGTLGINQDQAQAAIQQTQDEVARVEIERYGSEANEAQDNEQWQLAVQAYDQVLGIDANLIFAIEGRDYTEKRYRLDTLLESANANPERLADDGVYQQTLDVYYTGRAIENPGPRLLGQLDQLEVILENSQIVQSIAFVSDSLTQVTLLRVAEMGMFESQSLTLKTGRYVAVGKRDGYRDVRQEFVVGFGQTPESVIVKCDERIVATRGR
jgi:tetratricopeptide (TPR) repeat protein